MAQSAITVTPPNPTPPTNFGLGIANPYTAGTPGGTAGASSPPNPVAPGYAATVYNDPWHPGNATPTGPKTGAYTSAEIAGGQSVSTVPPYLEDGAGDNTAPLDLITGANDPRSFVTTLAFASPNSGQAAEGAGTETVNTQTYSASVLVPGVLATYYPNTPGSAWADGAPGGPVRTFSDEGSYVGGSASINGAHASVVTPAAISLGTNNTASGGGTVSQTVTGKGFTPQSVIYVNGVAQTTTFTSSTSVTAPTVTKKATAGTWSVFVFTPGILSSGTATWTFT